MKHKTANIVCGIAGGIAVSVAIYLISKNIIISIIGGLIVAIVFIIVSNYFYDKEVTEEWFNYYDKDHYISPDDIENKSKELIEAIELDNELCEFLDKYASGKENDMKETELNKQWKKKSKYFFDKADKILSKMTNADLLLVTLATKQLYMIVDFSKYVEPIEELDINYMIQNPNNLIPYYEDILEEHNALAQYSINENYFKIFEKNNKFEELEHFILSQMSAEELMELANKSKSWEEKLYYYGFLGEDKILDDIIEEANNKK